MELYLKNVKTEYTTEIKYVEILNSIIVNVAVTNCELYKNINYIVPLVTLEYPYFFKNNIL